MASPPLLERLGRALAPDHTVELELGSGGMGSVFLGADVALGRRVAIKILRPELATAEMAERFLTEARILAGLHHPNVVQIFRVGEAEGLYYYVMEYAGKESLDGRLARGPLGVEAALRLGRDLLDGLEAAHLLGVVHCDVKPANVMIHGRRALLTDFGIAYPHRRRDGAAPRALLGTPAYMAPEQLRGEEVSPRTDLYAVGALLFEAFTGRRWREGQTVWTGVPRSIAPVLQRALRDDPADRWPTAKAFRRALWRTRTRRYVRRTLILIAAGLAVGAIAATVAPRFFVEEPVGQGSLRVAVGEFEVNGKGAPAWLGDSVAEHVRTALGGQTDFQVASSGDAFGDAPVHLLVKGQLRVSDGTVHGRAWRVLKGRRDVAIGAEVAVPMADWDSLADLVASQLLLEVWHNESPTATYLPVAALPRTDAARAEFLRGERLIGQSRWAEAYEAYAQAETRDSTCLLCDWRMIDAVRWLGRPRDEVRTRRALAKVDSFPPVYRSLLRAVVAELPERIDTLTTAADTWHDFFLPSHRLAEELFHRGPLVGRLRREALEPLEHAARLRPDFMPIWEYIAWVQTTEGDSAAASAALAMVNGAGIPPDPYTRQFRALLNLGFAWRFHNAASAMRATENAVNASAIANFPSLGAGPRMLITFDAPAGAIALGQAFVRRPQRELVRSGAIAGMLGSFAMGNEEQVGAFERVLSEQIAEPEMELFLAEFAGLRAIVAPDPEGAARAVQPLRRLAAPGAGTSRARMRAAWMLTLLERETGLPRTHGLPRTLRQGPEAGTFLALLSADSLARHGHPERALEITGRVHFDSLGRVVDPFFRTVVRLWRARWWESAGNPTAAKLELRWHEHVDMAGFPLGPPQAAEVDWAFGTVARWRRAAVLERLGERGVELCSVYRGVARLWREGEGVLAARADSAARRANALGCVTPS